MPASATKAYQPTHAELLKVVTEYLDARGIYYFKVQGGLGQRSGIPDLVCAVPHIINGIRVGPAVFVGLEIKTGKGQPSGKQWREFEAIEAVGGIALIVRDLDDVRVGLALAGLPEPAGWPEVNGRTRR